jgi:RimJ/RimL family protein N-acetyltransferase
MPTTGQTPRVIGLDAGDGVLLALREAHLSARIAAACRRNAERLAPTMPWARDAAGLTDGAVAAYDRQTLHRLAAGTGLDLVIVRDDDVLGAVNGSIDGQGIAELGWWVDEAVEGTGLAFRGASTMAEHLVGRRDVTRLAARTRPDDRRSTALADRLDLVDHGVVSGVRAHSLPASTWRERHPAAGVELALAVDEELELVLTEPRFVPAMHTMTVANHDRLRPWEAWAENVPDPQQTSRGGRTGCRRSPAARPTLWRRGCEALGACAAGLARSHDRARIRASPRSATGWTRLPSDGVSDTAASTPSSGCSCMSEACDMSA